MLKVFKSCGIKSLFCKKSFCEEKKVFRFVVAKLFLCFCLQKLLGIKMVSRMAFAHLVYFLEKGGKANGHAGPKQGGRQQQLTLGHVRQRAFRDK